MYLCSQQRNSACVSMFNSLSDLHFAIETICITCTGGSAETVFGEGKHRITNGLGQTAQILAR